MEPFWCSTVLNTCLPLHEHFLGLNWAISDSCAQSKDVWSAANRFPLGSIKSVREVKKVERLERVVIRVHHALREAIKLACTLFRNPSSFQPKQQKMQHKIAQIAYEARHRPLYHSISKEQTLKSSTATLVGGFGQELYCLVGGEFCGLLGPTVASNAEVGGTWNLGCSLVVQ